MGKEEMIGACRFCGLAKLVEGFDLTQEAADEKVTRSCDCREGLSYRISCEKQDKREKNIEKLCDGLRTFFAFCESKGGETDDTVFEQLKQIGISVMDFKIGKVNVSWKRITLSISLNAKSEIVIGWTYKENEQMKI